MNMCSGIKLNLYLHECQNGSTGNKTFYESLLTIGRNMKSFNSACFFVVLLGKILFSSLSKNSIYYTRWNVSLQYTSPRSGILKKLDSFLYPFPFTWTREGKLRRIDPSFYGINNAFKLYNRGHYKTNIKYCKFE
jgi:hypothetical protein